MIASQESLAPQRAVDLVVRLRTAVERHTMHPSDDADQQIERAARELLKQLLGREPSDGEVFRARGV